MKHKIRDAMLAILGDACEALPEANEGVAGGRTRVATMVKTLLAADIDSAYRHDSRNVDPLALAHDAVGHADFAIAGTTIKEAFAGRFPGNSTGRLTIAGHSVKTNGHSVQLDNWTYFTVSHAEDVAVHHGLEGVCAERVEDILGIFRDVLGREIPDGIDLRVRHELDEKGNAVVIHDGWDQTCSRAEIRYPVDQHLAHDHLDRVASTIGYVVERQAKRRRKAFEIARDIAHITGAVTARLQEIASDLPLAFVGVEATNQNGSNRIRTEFVYEGTAFDFSVGFVRSEFRKDLEHYLAHSLPGLVAAQRALRARMDPGDAANVLVEGPIARLLMDRHGDDWVTRARAIAAHPGGARDDRGDWCASLSQGVLGGSIQLTPAARWTRGELRIDIAVPEATLVMMPGMPLSEIIAHPLFGPEVRVTKARCDKATRWTAMGSETFDVLTLHTNVPDLRLADFETMPLAA